MCVLEDWTSYNPKHEDLSASPLGTTGSVNIQILHRKRGGPPCDSRVSTASRGLLGLDEMGGSVRNSGGHMVSIPHHSLQRQGGGQDGWGALMERNKMQTLSPSVCLAQSYSTSEQSTTAPAQGSISLIIQPDTFFPPKENMRSKVAMCLFLIALVCASFHIEAFLKTCSMSYFALCVF